MTQDLLQRRRFQYAAAVSLAAALMVSTAACSSSGSSASTSSGGAKADSGSSQFAAALVAGYQGTYAPPPSTGAAAVKGKNVWVVSCGESSASCTGPAHAAMTAGAALGWKMHLVDGQLNPAKWVQGITDAIGAHADGVVSVAMDCSVGKAALQQAKQAGVPVIGTYAYDCGELKSGPNLFATKVVMHGIADFGAYNAEQGKLQADWLIQQTKGQAQVLDVNLVGFANLAAQHKGFLKEIKKCSSCKVVDQIDVSLTDVAANLAAQKFTTSLQKFPNANALRVPDDGVYQLMQIAGGLRQLNRTNLKIMGGQCLESALEEIRAGGPQQACVAQPGPWVGYAAADELNRYFADPKAAPVDEGVGLQVVDKDHNLPASGGWKPKGLDLLQAYEKVWSGA